MAAVGFRVALVTGSNRGIGYEIVRQLCRKFDGKVILSARNVGSGREAVKKLQEEGLAPEFLQLDVSSPDSIQSAKKEVEEKYGRLDVLINNAAILHKVGTVPLPEDSKQSIDLNYYGVLNVSNAFWPLLQPNSRVIQMTSRMGSLSKMSKRYRGQIRSPDLTTEQLSGIMDQFVRDAASPDYASLDWPEQNSYGCCYSISKVGVTKLALIQAKGLESDPRQGILVNAVCPGWVQTDMGGDSATKTVEEGADTAVYLALLPPGVAEPNGQLVAERKMVHFI